MAIVQNPVTGRSKNAFANAIFSTVLGKNVMRSKPLEVANPNTIPQQKARKKLAFLSGIAKRAKSAIEAGYGNAAIGMYPRNMFVRENLAQVTIDNSLNPSISAPNVKFSKGGLGDTPNITDAAVGGANLVQVDYETDNQSYPSTTKVVLIVMTEEGVVRGVNTNAGQYSGLLAEATITGATQGDYAYIFGYDTITGEVTDTAALVLS